MPAITLLAAEPYRLVNEPVGRGHLLEAGMVNHQIGTQHIQQREKVVTAELHRSGRHKNDGPRIVAKISDTLMQEGIRVPDVVRLIDDHEIESWSRIK